MRRMTAKRFASLSSAGLVACLAQPSSGLAADDPLGLYVGAGVGASHLSHDFFDAGAVGTRSPTPDRLGWKVFVGLRPLSYFGAELGYVDFGSTHLGPAFLVTYNGMPLEPDEFYGSHSDTKAARVFAVGYLPLGRFDLYGKLGVTHLWTRFSYAENYPDVFICTQTPTPTCNVPVGRFSVYQSNNDNGLGYGIGAQVRLGTFTMRADYERMSSPAGDPSLASIDFSWTFYSTESLAAPPKCSTVASLSCDNSAVASNHSAPFYFGAGLGQSSYQTGFSTYTGNFQTPSAKPLGWKVLVGTRPISFLGAELEYLDAGHGHFGPSGQILSTDTHARGGAAFILGYVPLPDPRLDVFAKLGGARYRSAYKYTGDFPNVCVFNPALNTCVPVGRVSVSSDSNVTALAYGIGTQLHLSDFLVRVEYERTSTATSATAPSLLSFGLIWQF